MCGDVWVDLRGLGIFVKKRSRKMIFGYERVNLQAF